MDNPSSCQVGEIAFSDSDASGWMHFPNVFKYGEAAEHACMRSHGLLAFARDGGCRQRVTVSCGDHRPFLAGDFHEVHLAVARVGASLATWKFEVFSRTSEAAAGGSMTNVRADQSGKPQLILPAERRVPEGRDT